MILRKKVCFLGADGVGKTSLIMRKIKNTFSESYLPTLGCDFYEYDYTEENNNNKELLINIWDIASQSMFKKLIVHYLSHTNLAVLVVDIDRTQEKYIKPWIEDIDSIAGEKVPRVMALNKTDLRRKEEIIEKVAEDLSDAYGLQVISTSAKLGTNVSELFEVIGEILYNKEEMKKNIVR